MLPLLAANTIGEQRARQSQQHLLDCFDEGPLKAQPARSPGLADRTDHMPTICSVISKVRRSEHLVRGIVPNNPLTWISRENCFLDIGKECSEQNNIDGRGVCLPCGFAGYWLREPICEKIQRSTET
jgi:hypothetical protein